MIGEGDRTALEVRVVAEPTGNRVSGKMLGRTAEGAKSAEGVTSDAATAVADRAPVRVPVIDIQSALLRDLFCDGGTVHVRVEAGRLILSRPALERRIAARLTDGSEGSVFSGGGLLTEAARTAGFTPRFAVELDERYAAIYEANHPTATMYRMSAHEAAFADLPRVELLTMGLPCEPWSAATRQAKGKQGQKRDGSLLRGLTQTELGHTTGFSQRMIVYYKTSDMQPPGSLLVALARPFKVPTDELLGPSSQ